MPLYTKQWSLRICNYKQNLSTQTTQISNTHKIFWIFSCILLICNTAQHFSNTPHRGHFTRVTNLFNNYYTSISYDFSYYPFIFCLYTINLKRLILTINSSRHWQLNKFTTTNITIQQYGSQYTSIFHRKMRISSYCCLTVYYFYYFFRLSCRSSFRLSDQKMNKKPKVLDRVVTWIMHIDELSSIVSLFDLCLVSVCVCFFFSRVCLSIQLWSKTSTLVN